MFFIFYINDVFPTKVFPPICRLGRRWWYILPPSVFNQYVPIGFQSTPQATHSANKRGQQTGRKRSKTCLIY